MRHRKHIAKFGRSSAHKKAMLGNMASSLILEGEIRTSVAKAKELRRFFDRLVSKGKKGDIHRRRLVVSKIKDKDAARILFEEIAPRYAERPGGYTRIIRTSPRRGDASEQCIVQLVEAQMTVKQKKSGKTSEKSQEKKSESKTEKAEDKKKTEKETAESKKKKDKTTDTEKKSESSENKKADK